MTLSLQEALAEVKRGPHWPGQDWKQVVDTILNAAASDKLTPTSDARLAVVAAYQRAGEAVGELALFDSHGHQACAYAKETILALADSDDLAEVEALREEREPDCTDCEGSGITHQTERYCTCGAGRELAVYARAEAAEAEVVRLREALKGAVIAMKAARGVIVSKREHALLTGGLAAAAEALSDAALTTPKGGAE